MPVNMKNVVDKTVSTEGQKLQELVVRGTSELVDL